MLKLSRLLVLLVSAALLLGACGGDDDEGGSGGGDAASGQAVDRAFAAEMIPHHESAVEMARIAQERGESAFVKDLAETIITTQSAEIETLRAAEARLAEAGVEQGTLDLPDHMMGAEMDLGLLESTENFDEEFLTMMIGHHESAVAMADVELAQGSDEELQGLAEEIKTAQEEEIAQMREHLGDAAPPEGEHGG